MHRTLSDSELANYSKLIRITSPIEYSTLGGLDGLYKYMDDYHNSDVKRHYLFRIKIIRIIGKYKKPIEIKKLIALLKESCNEEYKTYGENFFRIQERDFLNLLETKILYSEILKVTVRIWHKSKLFESPMSTHVSLETNNIYASLWPNRFEENLEGDLITRRHPPIDEYGNTIILYGLNPSFIEDSFYRLKESVSWDAYGSFNWSYLASLGRIFFPPCPIFFPLYLLDIIKDWDHVFNPEEETHEKYLYFYEKKRTIFNCSELVLSLLESGGVYKLFSPALMFPRDNEFLVVLKFLTFLSGIIFANYFAISVYMHGWNPYEGFGCIIAGCIMPNYLPLMMAHPDHKFAIFLRTLVCLFEAVFTNYIVLNRMINGNPGSDSQHNVGYILGEISLYTFALMYGATLVTHIPYCLASFYYECRGIGFAATPKGIEWMASKAQLAEKTQEEFLSEFGSLKERLSKVSESDLKRRTEDEPELDLNITIDRESGDGRTVNWLQQMHNSKIKQKPNEGTPLLDSGARLSAIPMNERRQSIT